MHATRLTVAALTLMSVAPPCLADTLELKNGQVLSGTYAGGTAGTVRFETGGGLQVLETSQILALTFTASTPPATPAPATPSPAAASAPVPAAAPAPASAISLPAGTPLLVRMVDGVSSRDAKGKRFTTTLETDLAVQGVVLAKAGSKVYGRVENAQGARRYAGQSTLDVRLTELALGGSLVPIRTGPYAQSGSRTVGKTARGAAAGAAIGAIADGGDGAATGAAIGAVASGLRRGQDVSLPPGTLLEFRLEQAVSATVAH